LINQKIYTNENNSTKHLLYLSIANCIAFDNLDLKIESLDNVLQDEVAKIKITLFNESENNRTVINPRRSEQMWNLYTLSIIITKPNGLEMYRNIYDAPTSKYSKSKI